VDGLAEYKAGRFKTTAEVLAHLRSLDTREEQRA
jgi:predicted transcriptional regulator